MARRSVALLIETSNGYSRGLFEGVIAYTKVYGNWSVYLTEQERGAAPPTWLKNWGPLGIQLRESTDTVAIEDDQIAKALQFIRRKASANIRVTDVLEHVDLSRRAFEHRFRKLVGLTPHEEIQRAWMNRVKELLRDTDLTVPQIAERLGFEHSEYLGAAFKREIGQSPGEYRRMHGNSES